MNINKYHWIIIFCFLAGAYPVFADSMSSPNYRIQSDSINVGGINQSSSSYRMEETIGEAGTGEMGSASYKLKAGYQEMQEVYLSISSPFDVIMSPAIGGVTGGTGDGQALWTVTTDNLAGYTLKIKASASPSLKCESGGCNIGVDSFADYSPAGSAPDYNWQISAADSEFGFTPEGIHITQKYKDNGVDTCNTGANDTADKCWYNFSTSNEDIASSLSSNHPTGTATTVKFRAQSGASHLQVEGNYQAAITATAVAN